MDSRESENAANDSVAGEACAVLRAKLGAIRNSTLAIYAHLTPAQMQVRYLPTINPPLWELGHVAWFQEYWCRCLRTDGPRLPSRYPHFDDWYNSSVIAHADRWMLAHPPREVILQQMRETLDDALRALEQADEAGRYFFDLAVLHEAMHAEALMMTLQTLGLPAPPSTDLTWSGKSHAVETASRDIAFAGGVFPMGTEPGTSRFVFDNEKWAHPVRVMPFAIANKCVSNAEFAAFVDDAGYARRECWSESGWIWRTNAKAGHPVYWRKQGAHWLVRTNDRWEPLDAAQPAMHVNLHEAQAWCAWANRRLPTEAEWEFAATGGETATFPWGDDMALLRDCALGNKAEHPAPAGSAVADLGPLLHLIGNVWEWTQTPFAPYPGFAPDPYEDYSAPWFGDHTVLRGGSFVTSSWLIHNRFRNFYKPERRDVFAGFRTCATG